MKTDIFEGILQHPIKSWADKALEHGLMSVEQHNSIVSSNNDKYNNLVVAKNSFSFNIQETIRLHPPFNYDEFNGYIMSLKTDRYNIRIVPILKDMNAKIYRKHGMTLSESYKYIMDKLDSSNYIIYATVYVEPIYSGTIISKADYLMTELVRGKHYHLTQAGTKKIYNAYWNKYRMEYSTNKKHIRKLLWEPINKIIIQGKNNFSPFNVPIFACGYFEYIYDAKLKLYLTDYTTQKYFLA